MKIYRNFAKSALRDVAEGPLLLAAGLRRGEAAARAQLLQPLGVETELFVFDENSMIFMKIYRKSY